MVCVWSRRWQWITGFFSGTLTNLENHICHFFSFDFKIWYTYLLGKKLFEDTKWRCYNHKLSAEYLSCIQLCKNAAKLVFKTKLFTFDMVWVSEDISFLKQNYFNCFKNRFCRFLKVYFQYNYNTRFYTIFLNFTYF